MSKVEVQHMRRKCPLFVFCKESLKARDPQAKVTDADVGNLLSFNASETSHWKRQKRRLKDVEDFLKLSKAFGVSVEQLYDISLSKI